MIDDPGVRPTRLTTENNSSNVISGTPIGQKRARTQLSCTLCRQGKLKCNKSHPACDQCRKRSRGPSCVYLAPATRNKSTENVKGRIKNLERLVVDLMNSDPNAKLSLPDGSSQSMPPKVEGADQAQDQLSREEAYHMDEAIGHMTISKGEMSYTGGLHWAALLDDIGEVRQYLNEHEEEHEADDDTNEEDMNHSSVLLGTTSSVMSRDELLNSVPSRTTCDRLVSQWFNSQDPGTFMLHGPTFQEEYKQFWKDPSSMPTAWLGMLFGIMCLASNFSQREQGDQSQSPLDLQLEEDVVQFRNLVASAVVMTGYEKPKPYILEATMLYTHCEYMRRTDVQVKIWALTGLIVRLALRMGYHRDSDHYPNISPFLGEMRRRRWCVIYQIDILVSFQLGLPSMVQKIESDTRLPRNLFDYDLSTDAPLPAERPSTEITTASYPIAKFGLCSIFAAAAEQSHAIKPPTLSEVMQLDARLQEVYERVPPMLRVRSMAQSITDPPELIMSRFNLELMYQKTRCVLHRRYLAHANSSGDFAYSHAACIDAAMKVLRHHDVIRKAVQPLGQLYRVRWYMSSLSAHDFLLSSMIICLELSLRAKAKPDRSEQAMHDTKYCEQDMRDALETSYEIWQNGADFSLAARQASDALAIMLGKLGEGNTTKKPKQKSDGSRGSLATSESPPSNSGYSMTSSEQQFSAQTMPEFSEFSTIGNMFDMPTDINWDLWDNQINGQKEIASDMLWTMPMDGQQMTDASDLNVFDNPEYNVF